MKEVARVRYGDLITPEAEAADLQSQRPMAARPPLAGAASNDSLCCRACGTCLASVADAEEAIDAVRRTRPLHPTAIERVCW